MLQLVFLHVELLGPGLSLPLDHLVAGPQRVLALLELVADLRAELGAPPLQEGVSVMDGQQNRLLVGQDILIDGLTRNGQQKIRCEVQYLHYTFRKYIQR